MSQTQSLTLTEEWSIDVTRVYSATFQRSSFVFCAKKHWINLPFLFLNVLRVLAKATNTTFWYYNCNLRLSLVIYVQCFDARNIL